MPPRRAERFHRVGSRKPEPEIHMLARCEDTGPPGLGAPKGSARHVSRLEREALAELRAVIRAEYTAPP
jgi:hypothetical protein